MRTLVLLLSLSILFSCNEGTTTNQDFELNVRIEKDPGQINPFYATTSIGREIYQYIFVPLADFHPESLELFPVLIEEIPEAYDTVVGEESYIAYDIKFREEAKWSDGADLTNRDYLFTIQMIKHPDSKITAWKPYFEFLKAVELDADDENSFTVFFDPDYMLSKEVALTGFLMPSHIYDSESLLFAKGNAIIADGYENSDTMETQLVESVNATVNDKLDVVQLGPYYLSDFQTDEYVILKKREDYWATDIEDNPYLIQGPSSMIFRIVPDEVSATNMAKEGRLDFLSLRSADRFLELKDDSVFSANWNFHTPQIMRYYYLAMNNTAPYLSDVKVRQALTHLTDVDDFINNIEGGLGTRTIGHFNPSKPYYNNNLAPRAYDIEKATSLLNEAGWSDSDGNGILDRTIKGNQEELTLELLITGSELSRKIALLFQESCIKAGVKVEIATKKTSLMRKENIGIYNYDMAALAATQDAAPDDPYSRWHSDNAKPGTRNETAYNNERADVLIENIRNTRSSDERKAHYMEFQEILYDDCPVIFLYCPNMKILTSSRLKASTSSKRPGYLANTFELAE